MRDNGINILISDCYKTGHRYWAWSIYFEFVAIHEKFLEEIRDFNNKHRGIDYTTNNRYPKDIVISNYLIEQITKEKELFSV